MLKAREHAQIQLVSASNEVKDHRSPTFVDNLSLPVHRWFRFPAGFSGVWAGTVMEGHAVDGKLRVLDPFAGSGTVPVEAFLRGYDAIGVEAHPFLWRIAKAKVRWPASADEFITRAYDVLSCARRSPRSSTSDYPELVRRCFGQESLRDLDGLRRSVEHFGDDSDIAELSWLTLASILRESSRAGTAQWQYILPSKRKVRVSDPFDAFQHKATQLGSDMAVGRRMSSSSASIQLGDARNCSSVPEGWADLVLTSPPYCNNYDYADATRFEMSFFGEVERWGDLQDKVRRFLVRSCSQHVTSIVAQTDALLRDDHVSPISAELVAACEALDVQRRVRKGHKAYHTMVAAYFNDLARVWKALRRCVRPGGRACFVVGDSAPYGVHVPVERWLGELALAAGFESYRFEKVRDRNVKWRNRKHRVPLHEGRLWVEG